MLKKFLINRFNKKYAGKELMFCSRIYEDISFLPIVTLKCCHCNRMPYSPPLFYPTNIEKQKPEKILKLMKKFNFFEYLKNIDKLMQLNQTQKGGCQGCTFLKKQIVPQLPYEKQLTFFTINHFTKCNSNCVYCAIGRKTEDIKFKLLPILKRMVKDKMLNDSCLINWGGGEPTICSEFEELAQYFHDHNIRQAINSSGIEFSQTILDGLKDGSMSIQISPDSGTEETYRKIKRQNNFYKVWENIKKYAQYPDMLFVKYIFFAWSANENDVRMFIQKCIESGVKNIVIDCESNSAANNPRCFWGNITEDIVNLAILMKHLAIENNIKYEISYQWRDENKKKIEEG